MKSQRLSKIVLFICVSELFGLDLVAQDGKDSAIYINIEEHLKPSEGIPALIEGKHIAIDGGEIRWIEVPAGAEDTHHFEILDSDGEILPVGGYFTEDYGAVRMVLGFNFGGDYPEIRDMAGVILNFMLPVCRVYDIHLNEAGEVTFLEHGINIDSIADIKGSSCGLIYIPNLFNDTQPQLLVDCARIDADLLWKRKED